MYRVLSEDCALLGWRMVLMKAAFTGARGWSTLSFESLLEEFLFGGAAKVEQRPGAPRKTVAHSRHLLSCHCGVAYLTSSEKWSIK